MTMLFKSTMEQLFICILYNYLFLVIDTIGPAAQNQNTIGLSSNFNKNTTGLSSNFSNLQNTDQGKLSTETVPSDF